ncbi:MAG: sugar phosphate nucleotidyltransferase [Candidatus Shapirobacteria bacterium]
MPTITKAVIACGGYSTRFLPTVKTYAKQLIPILDKPQIQWVIEELIGAGITDMVIVHRDGEETLKKHFTRDAELDAYLDQTGKQKCLDSLEYIWSKTRLDFLPQTKEYPYGNGVPILVAQDFIGSDPFIYLWGDDITLEDTPGAFLTKAIALYQQYSPAVLECVQWMPDDVLYRYGTVKYVDDPKYPHRISELKEKLPFGQAPSNFIQGGRFVCSPKVIEVLKKTAVSKGELWFADAVNFLAQTDVVMTHNYTENNALWSTTGDPLNWLRVNLYLASRHPDFQGKLELEANFQTK